MSDEIKVVELFAGVGGFRLGLEGWKGCSASSGYTQPIDRRFEVVWSNQWEPGASRQTASDIYKFHWGSLNHANENIHEVALSESLGIPPHDMIVGGFPCQDYSVANTLRNSGGIKGKKGVLWWDIHRILERLYRDEGSPTKYLLLENVDRLLKSPVRQRGRDFAIMLGSLAELDYVVEWRVINAADYGMPQRRRRVFILAYHKSTPLAEAARNSNPGVWLTNTGVIANAFPPEEDHVKYATGSIIDDSHDLTLKFNVGGKHSPFSNAGLFVDSTYFTTHLSAPLLTDEVRKESALRRFLDTETDLTDYYVSEEIVRDNERGWAFHKGPKSRPRMDPDTGHVYQWSEGGMSLTDDLDLPARTIITSEGGATPSRSKHLIETDDGRYRRLTPIELELVTMFPKDHTKYGLRNDGEYLVPPTARAFCIGNALVVGVVEKIGHALDLAIRGEEEFGVSTNREEQHHEMAV